MDLKTYLSMNHIECKEFASKIGVHPNTIYNYIHWRRKPALDVGRKIEKATRGKVKIDDLLTYWEMKKKHG